MDELIDKILEDLGESWEGVALLGPLGMAAILNGQFIEEFIRLGSYARVAEHFNIHIQTVSKIVDNLFTKDSYYWPHLSHNTWV